MYLGPCIRDPNIKVNEGGRANIMNRTCVVLENRGLIKVSGEDRAEFLQGLISNDINHVAPDRVIWAALLTPQGKYLHDFFVIELDGAFYLDCEAERLMDLGQRLRKYVLRAKVSLDVVEGFSVTALFGDGALQALALPEEDGAARAWDRGMLYVDPRLAAAGARARVITAALSVRTRFSTLASYRVTYR